MSGPKRILLIDDDKEDFEIFEDTLNRLGYAIELMHEEDCETAVQKLSQDQFPDLDLIILDWYMPRIRGNECIKAIKNLPRFSNVPVVIYTGSASITHMEEAKQLGISYFLQKPSDLGTFKEQLRSVLASSLSGK